MLSEDVWEAMHKGQTVPRGMSEREAWRILGDAACRTVIDVQREDCLKRLGDEYDKASLAKIVAERRLAELVPAMAAVEYATHGWEEKYRNVMIGARTDG
jgi:hypothetical protein